MFIQVSMFSFSAVTKDNVLKTALTRLVSYLIVLYYFLSECQDLQVLVNSIFLCPHKQLCRFKHVYVGSNHVTAQPNIPAVSFPVAYLHCTMTKYTLYYLVVIVHYSHHNN